MWTALQHGLGQKLNKFQDNDENIRPMPIRFQFSLVK